LSLLGQSSAIDRLAEADELVELVRVVEIVVERLPVPELGAVLPRVELDDELTVDEERVDEPAVEEPAVDKLLEEEELLVDVVETPGDTAACLIAPTKEMSLGDVV
jgi:hypothetical protein